MRPYRMGIFDGHKSPKLTLVTGDVVDAVAYDVLQSSALGIGKYGIGSGAVDIIEPIDIHAADVLSVIVECYHGRYRVTVEKLPPHFGTMERGA